MKPIKVFEENENDASGHGQSFGGLVSKRSRCSNELATSSYALVSVVWYKTVLITNKNLSKTSLVLKIV